MFEPNAGSTGFYLLTNQHTKEGIRIVSVDRQGVPLAYAKSLDARKISPERSTIISDSGGVWLIGDQWSETAGKSLLWVERIVFQ